MIMKGNTAALMLWLLLTSASVLMSGWMHQLANRTPSQEDARQITNTLQYQVQQLENRLIWASALPSSSLTKFQTPADLRLIVNSSDVLLYQVQPQWEQEKQTLLVSLVNFLSQPRNHDMGVTYWRDKVLLVNVREEGGEKRLVGVFLDHWLQQLVNATGVQVKLTTAASVAGLKQQGHALVALPAIQGDAVYLDGEPVLLNEAIPFRWWLALPISAFGSALIVWFFYYNPVWRRIQRLQQQARLIMQSSSFRDRVQVAGKDEIGDLGIQFNSLLSSLEYCYNLMAKTNLVSTELLAKMESSQSLPMTSAPVPDEPDLKQTLDMASRFSEALDRGAIELYLQPVFGQDRTTLTGYEALSRWLDSELGMVMPLEYLAVAEKAGLIEPLTELMLKQTFSLLRRLPAGDRPVTISLNLSAAQLFAPGLMNYFLQCDDEEQALFPRLELEVKESALTRDFDQVSSLVVRLRELGIGICIDDYGLSRYSLMYLQQLPVTSIKLARVFSERISREPREVAFIEGVSRFAGGLGVRVIVKNLENDQQLDSLRADLPVEYQGLALGGPVPAETVL